jgi:hypothetical protein
MDRNLSVTQVGALYSKFNEVDEIGGNGITERCKSFVINVEEKLKNQKEVRLKEFVDAPVQEHLISGSKPPGGKSLRPRCNHSSDSGPFSSI